MCNCVKLPHPDIRPRVYATTRLVFAVLCALPALGFASGSIHTSIQLESALTNRTNLGRLFDLRGIVSFISKERVWMMTVRDSSGAMTIFEANPKPRPSLDVGDCIRATGHLATNDYGRMFAEYDAIEVLSRYQPEKQETVPARTLFDNSSLGSLLRVTGIVREVVRDESAKDWIYLQLNDHGTSLCVMIRSHPDEPIDRKSLLGSKVSILGACTTARRSARRYAGKILIVSGLRHLTMLDGAGNDPFSSPPIETLADVSPSDLQSCGLHTAKGTVIAVWSPRNAMIRTAEGIVINFSLDDDRLPVWGSQVDVAGLPDTNLYHLQLSHAQWRLAGTAPVTPAKEEPISAERLLARDPDINWISVRDHGKTIRLTGVIRHLPSENNVSDRCIYLESNSVLVPVDVTGAPNVTARLSVGCTISASGAFVVERPPWSPGSASPSAQKFRIALRTADDLIVLSSPPWWTPLRLWSVIGALAACLLGFVTWNALLRKIAHRRGRELAREQISRAEAELKIQERTRLAVELHDTLSQNLMGVSMHLDAVRRASDPTSDRLQSRIETMARALRSCREELRNCLWDLRSEAFDEPDMNKAIHQTLVPHIDNGVSVVIRFNVPRRRLSDQTAHALLRIIRELVLNAVRHGNATAIKIAGSIENDVLRFSVRDNGSGFDVHHVPGTTEGHFGLQGIRDRIDFFNGGMTIDSGIGRGTRINIAIGIGRTQTGLDRYT